jgi:hypothetical protein
MDMDTTTTMVTTAMDIMVTVTAHGMAMVMATDTVMALTTVTWATEALTGPDTRMDTMME